MSDDLVATTVRLPQAQLDALDAMSEDGEIPNRSEGIRSAIGFALDSDEWEISEDARKLAAFKRTKRLSQVHFYREGFRPMVRRVLQAVGSTSPPWEPEQVERTAPLVFEEQIKTLFDSEERREWAQEVLSDEISRYADAYLQEQPDDDNPYVDAFRAEFADERGVVERINADGDGDHMLPDAIRMLDRGLRPVDVAERLSKRQGVDADTAAAVVEEAETETRRTPALADGGEADE